MVDDWEFRIIETHNGSFEAGGGAGFTSDDEGIPYGYVVEATRELPPADVYIYGYGHTESEAKTHAVRKVEEFEDEWLTYE